MSIPSMHHHLTPVLCLALGCAAAGGDGVTGSGPGGGSGKADSSAHAVFLDFEIDGELLTDRPYQPQKEVEAQLMYTVGQLNGERSVGRLDRIEILSMESEPAGEQTRVRYRARMPVAWNRANDVPETYELLLPADVSLAGQERFATQYGSSCVEYGSHEDAGVFWYYYRPEGYRCELAEGDIVRAEARVEPSPLQTTGKYPEYDRIWEDDVLRVVAITGKDEDGATSNSDAGISSYNQMVREMAELLAPYAPATVPEELPQHPGIEVPEVRFEAELDGGFRIVAHLLLVDNVRTAGADFDRRYEELSGSADYIVYNGHSGLGRNIRALASKGRWVTGQYVIVFMNGCDTYAYVDSALADAHAAVNPDDPNGTRYVDIVANAMPSPVSREVDTALDVLRGLLSYEEPMTYEEIFENINASQVVLVTGEQDNEFTP